MKTLPVKKLFIVLCVSFFIPVHISAQRTPVKIYGIITDEFGAVISGANVTINQVKSAEDQAKTQTTSSNSDGEFSIDNLAAGTYKLNAEYVGGLSYENENVAVVDNQSTKLNIQLCVGGCASGATSLTTNFTDADKADIVNQILEDALVKKTVPDYELLTKQKGEIVLSSENIKAEWIKPLSNIKLKVMSESEIQNKADNTKDFLYLSFSKFKFAKKGIVVTFSNGWAVGKHSGIGYLSGGGSIYLYRKESGKWIGESLGGWIS